jgi:hypothetical protein
LAKNRVSNNIDGVEHFRAHTVYGSHGSRLTICATRRWSRPESRSWRNIRGYTHGPSKWPKPSAQRWRFVCSGRRATGPISPLPPDVHNLKARAVRRPARIQVLEGSGGKFEEKGDHEYLARDSPFSRTSGIPSGSAGDWERPVRQRPERAVACATRNRGEVFSTPRGRSSSRQCTAPTESDPPCRHWSGQILRLCSGAGQR